MYLKDKEQKLKKLLGAMKSPQVVLLKYDKGGYNTFYNGSIDNNPQVATDVKFHYLKDNINNLLSGKTAVKNSAPVMGCMIK